MKRYIHIIAVLAALIFSACDKTPKGDDEKIDVQLEIPNTVTLSEDALEFTFRVMFSKAPLATDKIVFEGSGKKYDCPMTVSDKSVTVTFPSDIVSGPYKVYLQRGSAQLLLGETSVLVQSAGSQLDPGTTVYGTVSCGDELLKGVVVSDGVEVAVTDDKGMYQLKSQKKHKYVFISVPGGYEVKADGVFPRLYQQLKTSATTLENVNFELVKADGQDNHTLIVMGDMHLANRNNDLAQFGIFIDEINNYLAANAGRKIYGITLGDMSWDCYWSRLDLPSYKTHINKIKGMQIFHSMGNHDYDEKLTGDFDTAAKYKELIAPSYYSFNIGKVHYIVIDNIDCTNNGTTEGRAYTANIVKEQVDWLKKDLSHVAKDTPLILSMHAPFRDVKNKNEIISIIAPYENVHFLSGHTHKVTNYSEPEYKEHVSGAVCADWWWSGKHNETLLNSTDGAPGGYAVWEVTGKDFKWRYKATGRTDDYQFRSYDLNNVAFTAANLSSDIDKDNLKNYVAAYPASSGNEVLINVWNWNNGWKITVTDEKGNQLKTTHTSAFDPLHIATRYQWSSTTTSNFGTQKNGDYFKVTAADADVDLTITVEDEFGNVFTEKMQRPKAFTKDTYK